MGPMDIAHVDIAALTVATDGVDVGFCLYVESLCTRT